MPTRLVDPRDSRAILLERILQAATELFGSQGFDASSLEDVATAAQMTKAGLQYYIGSKDELLYRIIHRINTEGTAAVAEIVGRDLPPPQKLSCVLLRHCQLVARHQDAIKVYNDEWKHLSSISQGRLEGDRRGYTDLLSATIREGVRSDDFRSLDLRLTVGLIRGVLNSMYRWYDPTRHDAAGAAVAISDLLFGGFQVALGDTS
jgi:AcrR family transcriptional regulator